MAGENETERTVAICENCGSVYAARVTAGADIQPIGSKACSCGAGEFQLMDASPDLLEEPRS